MRIRKTVTLDSNLEGFANPEDVQKYMDEWNKSIDMF